MTISTWWLLSIRTISLLRWDEIELNNATDAKRTLDRCAVFRRTEFRACRWWRCFRGPGWVVANTGTGWGTRCRTWRADGTVFLGRRRERCRGRRLPCRRASPRWNDPLSAPDQSEDLENPAAEKMPVAVKNLDINANWWLKKPQEKMCNEILARASRYYAPPKTGGGSLCSQWTCIPKFTVPSRQITRTSMNNTGLILTKNTSTKAHTAVWVFATEYVEHNQLQQMRSR